MTTTQSRPVSDRALHGAASALIANGDSPLRPAAGDSAGQLFDAAAWQASMDAEGRFIALQRRVRMSRYLPVRPEGEPSLLVAVGVLICIAALLPFVVAVIA